MDIGAKTPLNGLDEVLFPTNDERKILRSKLLRNNALEHRTIPIAEQISYEWRSSMRDLSLSQWNTETKTNHLLATAKTMTTTREIWWGGQIGLLYPWIKFNQLLVSRRNIFENRETSELVAITSSVVLIVPAVSCALSPCMKISLRHPCLTIPPFENSHQFFLSLSSLNLLHFSLSFWPLLLPSPDIV